MPGLEDLEKTIKRFEDASAKLREESRLAHEAAKAAKEQRQQLEQSRKDILDSVDKIIERHVAKQMEVLGFKAQKASAVMYKKVGDEIDIMINTALGKRLTRSGRHEDLRPKLAEMLGIWIREELEKLT
jgi:undecaprenyl pyrophosphate synthase